MRQFVRERQVSYSVGKEEAPISIRYFLPRRRRSQNKLQLEQQYSEQRPELPVNVQSIVIPKEIVEILKVETALELGVSDYQQRFNGDYPATVHAQISKYLRMKLKVLSQKIEEDPSIIKKLQLHIKK